MHRPGILGDRMTTHRFPLAAMDLLNGVMTVVLLLLPLLLLAPALVSSLGGEGSLCGGADGLASPSIVLGAIGLFIAVLYAGIVVVMRPLRFEVSPRGVVLVWPFAKACVPIEDIRAVELLDRKGLRQRVGGGMRVGAGGLFGGFGLLMGGSRTHLMFISRVSNLVRIDTQITTPLLLTPKDPEGFVRRLGELGVAVPACLGTHKPAARDDRDRISPKRLPLPDSRLVPMLVFDLVACLAVGMAALLWIRACGADDRYQIASSAPLAAQSAEAPWVGVVATWVSTAPALPCPSFANRAGLFYRCLDQRVALDGLLIEVGTSNPAWWEVRGTKKHISWADFGGARSARLFHTEVGIWETTRWWEILGGSLSGAILHQGSAERQFWIESRSHLCSKHPTQCQALSSKRP